MKLEIGKVYSHVAYPDLKVRIAGFKNGRQVNCEILQGWRGPTIPRNPVPIPKDKLVEAEDEPSNSN